MGHYLNDPGFRYTSEEEANEIAKHLNSYGARRITASVTPSALFEAPTSMYEAYALDNAFDELRDDEWR